MLGTTSWLEAVELGLAEDESGNLVVELLVLGVVELGPGDVEIGTELLVLSLKTIKVEDAAGSSEGLGVSVMGAEEGVTASGVGVADDAYTTRGIVRSSLRVEDDSAVVWVSSIEDEDVYGVSTGTEEERSHDGVTGMTVKIL